MFSRSIAAIALGIGFALAFTSAALGATGSSTYASPGEHAFVVPAGVKSVRIKLIGGRGGGGLNVTCLCTSIPGGAPSTVTAILAVTPGKKLYAEVAGDGLPATAAGQGAPGSNGGGAGGEIFPFPCLFFCQSIPSGGGGGGASDVRTCSELPSKCTSLLTRLVVAAGGGGGGGASALGSGGSGGNGDAAGVSGQPDDHGDPGGGGGGRATPTAAGAVGFGNGGFSGTLGTGGSGQATFGASPGGGGGGLYGGGSGGEGGASSPNQSTLYAAGSGGGGGGSSGVPSAAKGVSDYQFVPTATGAQPLIRITWVLPRPSVATGAARRLTRTAAVLTGLLDPNGYPVSACHFLLLPGGRSVPCSQHLGGGAKAVGVSARVAGLAPATGYRFRLAAASANGVATGSTVRFRTLH